MAKRKDNRPKNVIKFSQYCSCFILSGALWLIAGIALMAMPYEGKGAKPIGFMIAILLIGLVQFIRGAGAVIGIRKKKTYAIGMGLLAAVSYMLFVLIAMAYGALQGHLNNIQPHNLIILLLMFFFGLMVIRYAVTFKVRQNACQINRPVEVPAE